MADAAPAVPAASDSAGASPPRPASISPQSRAHQLRLRLVEVNGGPGALYLDPQQRLLGVCALDITDGQITSISAIVNPDKLPHLGSVADFRSLVRSAR